MYSQLSTLPPYTNPCLLPENVFGHTKKVSLLRESIDQYRLLNKKSTLNILDLGCGSGFAVTRFLPREGDRVLSIDMHPPNIQYARSNYTSDNLSFLLEDASNLVSMGVIYDVVVLSDLLEHLENPGSILSLATDLLAPGGILLVSVPNGYGPFEIESALSRAYLIGPFALKAVDISVAILDKTIMRRKWSHLLALLPEDLPYNSDSGHVQFFTYAEINRLFNKHCLTVDHSENLSFLSGPFTNYILAPFKTFCLLNTRLAKLLPYSLTSACYFQCSKSCSTFL